MEVEKEVEEEDHDEEEKGLEEEYPPRACFSEEEDEELIEGGAVTVASRYSDTEPDMIKYTPLDVAPLAPMT